MENFFAGGGGDGEPFSEYLGVKRKLAQISVAAPKKSELPPIFWGEVCPPPPPPSPRMPINTGPG